MKPAICLQWVAALRSLPSSHHGLLKLLLAIANVGSSDSGLNDTPKAQKCLKCLDLRHLRVDISMECAVDYAPNISKPQVNQLFRGDLRHRDCMAMGCNGYSSRSRTIRWLSVLRMRRITEQPPRQLPVASAADRCMEESNASGAFIRKCCARSLARKLVKQNDVCGRGVQLFHGFCPVCKLIYLTL